VKIGLAGSCSGVKEKYYTIGFFAKYHQHFCYYQ